METRTSRVQSETPLPNTVLGNRPSLRLDIGRELEGLKVRAALQQGAWKKGVVRKLLVDYPDLRISLIYLEANGQIEEHYNPGRITVQTVTGRIRMSAAGEVFDLPVGSVLVLERAVPHQLEALEESAFLLTVAPAENDRIKRVGRLTQR